MPHKTFSHLSVTWPTEITTTTKRENNVATFTQLQFIFSNHVEPHSIYINRNASTNLCLLYVFQFHFNTSSIILSANWFHQCVRKCDSPYITLMYILVQYQNIQRCRTRTKSTFVPGSSWFIFVNCQLIYPYTTSQFTGQVREKSATWLFLCTRTVTNKIFFVVN